MNKFFKIVLSIVVAAAIVIIGGFVYHAAVNPKPAAHQEKTSRITQDAAKTVTLEIKDGKKTVTGKVPVKNGDTALQVLKSYTSSHHMEIATTGSGKMAYVTSLEHVKAGGKSGWMFSVNGKEPNVGAGATVVKPGAKIVWYFKEFK